MIEQKVEFNIEKKYIYLLLFIPNTEKIDLKNLKFTSEISPKTIFCNFDEKENKIVLKYNKKSEKKEGTTKKKEENKYTTIIFIEGDYEYIISFREEDRSFIYLPDLKKRNIYLYNILDERIVQDSPLYIKLDIFLEALEKNNENNIKEKLFEDSISLYKEKKKFSFLIVLFLKTYKNRNLCDKLISIFYEINEKENKDKEKYLITYLEEFKHIYGNAKEIIDENKYNPIYFYGILFCYLHYYDKENFAIMIKEFSKENSYILFEILIQYYSHFMNPLNQNQKFYDDFIKYIKKKEIKLKILYRALNYIEDIETFLFVINENKREIAKIYYYDLKKYPIKMKENLKLIKYAHEVHEIKNEINDNSDNELDLSDEDNKNRSHTSHKNECEYLVKLIENIISFSLDNKILIIYMQSTFWEKIINEYYILLTNELIFFLNESNFKFFQL